MDQDKKRELRQLKREIKRAGGKRRRRQLKQGLAEHPEEAHEQGYDFGKLRSAELNGFDRPPERSNPAADLADHLRRAGFILPTRPGRPPRGTHFED